MSLPIDQAAFFASARTTLFGGFLAESQVNGINAILDAWDLTPYLPDLRMVSYALATAYHETDQKMQPIREYGLGRRMRYGAPAGPYKQVYYGRGLVQLTWWSNYDKADTKLHAIGLLGPGQSLVQTPDLALQPDIASAIMVHGMLEGWFTGHSLSNFFNSGTDWVHAREIINGMDRAAVIAGYAIHFNTALNTQDKVAA